MTEQRPEIDYDALLAETHVFTGRGAGVPSELADRLYDAVAELRHQLDWAKARQKGHHDAAAILLRERNEARNEIARLNGQTISFDLASHSSTHLRAVADECERIIAERGDDGAFA